MRILINLIVGIIGNFSYFFGCYGNYPECGNTCLIFFNIAWITNMFATFSSTLNEERQYVGGRSIIATSYLVAESICALYCISGEVTMRKAGVIQLILLGIAAIVFFYALSADRRSERSFYDESSSSSIILQKANYMLRSALGATADNQEREIFRLALSELNSCTFVVADNSKALDNDILSKTEYLCANPSKDSLNILSLLIAKRKYIFHITNN